MLDRKEYLPFTTTFLSFILVAFFIGYISVDNIVLTKIIPEIYWKAAASLKMVRRSLTHEWLSEQPSRLVKLILKRTKDKW